jgi:RNA-directed DNA polymerase
MLEECITGCSLIQMIRKWLKAGAIEGFEHCSPFYEGAPQGGIISPLLGNIYLHFAHDLWIKKAVV